MPTPSTRGGVMADALTESEIEMLRRGATGAGLLVSVSDRRFFDTFKEAGTMAKHIAAARSGSDSEVVRQVAEGRGVGFGVTSSPQEIESATLDSLRSAVTLLREKAPVEVEAYRTFVLDLARSVASAAPGGEDAEAATVGKIEAALRDAPERQQQT